MDLSFALVRRAVRLAGFAVIFAAAPRAGAQLPAAEPAPADSLRDTTRAVAPAPTAAALGTAADAATPAVLDSAAGDVDAVRPARDSVSLIKRLLVANGAPEGRAGPVARAVIKYAALRSLDPLLVVGVIGVENAELVSRARSRVGATGIMQVMPHWKRDIHDCGGYDLSQVAVNVCFATRVLRIAMDESTTVRQALLRYNGCVKSPGCHKYASAVFSQAGRAVLLSRLDTATAAGAGARGVRRGG